MEPQGVGRRPFVSFFFFLAQTYLTFPPSHSSDWKPPDPQSQPRTPPWEARWVPHPQRPLGMIWVYKTRGQTSADHRSVGAQISLPLSGQIVVAGDLNHALILLSPYMSLGSSFPCHDPWAM